MTPGLDLVKVPVLVRGRLLGPSLLAITFLAAIWLHLAPRQVLIPLYMLANLALASTLQIIDLRRLGAYLKAHFPDEYRAIVPREDEYGFMAAIMGRFVSAQTGGEIKRRSRRVWMAQLWLLPFMMLVIVVGAELSK